MALSVVTVQCSVKLHLNSHHIFLQKQQLFFHSVGPFIAETQFGQKEADILEWNFCINIVSAPWKSLNPDFLSLFAHLSHLHAHALNPGSKDFCFMKRNVWPVGIKSPTDCVIIRFSLKANFRVFFFFFFLQQMLISWHALGIGQILGVFGYFFYMPLFVTRNRRLALPPTGSCLAFHIRLLLFHRLSSTSHFSISFPLNILHSANGAALP